MAIENIPINSGTGPSVAADLVGTDYYQVVKICQGLDGASGSLADSLAISGTVSISSLPVISAANITVASITTGTVNVVNTPTVTATVNSMPVVTITASANPIIVSTVSTVLTMPVVTVTASANPLVVSAVYTAHSSRWDAYAVNTTSGASVIVKTSGAHTLYITDLIVSVDVPSVLSLFSAATTKFVLYLATRGGMAVAFRSPMVLNSAQSLTFTPSVSGSAMCYAAGYSVT